MLTAFMLCMACVLVFFASETRRIGCHGCTPVMPDGFEPHEVK